jgi:coatomer protein complex subunit alpha (xenin)
VVNFEPYRALFLASYSHSRTSFPGAVGLPSLLAYPARNWRAAAQKEQLPVLGLTLRSCMDKLKVRH